MSALSLVVITKNEESRLARCLASVHGVCDEILVVDSGSTDRTCEIARGFGARVLTHAFEGHVLQKRWATAQAAHDRILALDADEALTPELRSSIAAVEQRWTHDAWQVKRLARYCGRWVRHGGWYPDAKIRLFDRRAARWGGRDPHDKVLVEPGRPVGRLSGDLLHYTCESLEEHVAKVNRYSTIAARALFAEGRRSRLVRDVILDPPATFLAIYLLRLGFLDGRQGLAIAAVSALAKLLKYAKLRDLARPRQADPLADLALPLHAPPRPAQVLGTPAP